MKFAFPVVAWILLASCAQAADVNAASASNTDIQAAIDDGGTVNGDTIIVPAGDVTWTGAVNFGNKNLTLQGNGIGSTICTYSAKMVDLSDTESRVTGFTFKNSGNSSTNILDADTTVWCEIDNCRFESTVANFLVGVHFKNPAGVPSSPFGIVHSCQFFNARVLMQGGVALTGGGRELWADSERVLGAANNVFVEDNTFENTVFGNAMDNGNGGYYVFRYNTLTNVGPQAHGITSTSERGTKAVEIYNNTFIRDTGTDFLRAVFLRGGSAVLYNNTLTEINGGSWSNPGNFAIDSEIRTGGDTGQGDDAADGNLPTPEVTGVYYHDGGESAVTLSASGASWAANVYVGMVVHNRTDGSLGAITENSSTTITATLSGGLENDWDVDDQFFVTDATGTHTGSSGAAILTDSAATDWGINEWVNSTAEQGSYVYNVTDGSLGSITANDGTTVTATLGGGTEDDWDTGDVYLITNGWPWRDQLGTGTDSFEYTGTGPWPEQAFGLQYGYWEWDNTLAGGDVDFGLVSGAAETAFENRDYFNDQSAITVWGYTPYTYPHPLRSDAPAASGTLTTTTLTVGP